MEYTLVAALFFAFVSVALVWGTVVLSSKQQRLTDKILACALVCSLFGLALSACSVTLLPSPRVRGLAQPAGPTATPEECDALDRAATGWTATAVVGGVLGGGSGISTLFTSDSVSHYVVGGITIGVAAVTAAAGYLSTAYAQKYVSRCTSNSGGVAPAK